MLIPQSTLPTAPIDLELIAQRVLKLAEIATLDHLQALQNSQADALLARSGQMPSQPPIWAEPKR